MAGEKNGRVEFCTDVAKAVDQVLERHCYPLGFRQLVRVSTVLSVANNCFSVGHQDTAITEALTAARKVFAEDCRFQLEDALIKKGYPEKDPETKQLVEQIVETIANEAYDFPPDTERTVQVVIAVIAETIAKK